MKSDIFTRDKYGRISCSFNHCIWWKDKIRYKKWILTDRTNMIEIVESIDEFIENFSIAIVALLRHNFVTKKAGPVFKKTQGESRGR